MVDGLHLVLAIFFIVLLCQDCACFSLQAENEGTENIPEIQRVKSNSSSCVGMREKN